MATPKAKNADLVTKLESDAVQRCTQHDLDGSLDWMLPDAVAAAEVRAGVFYVAGSTYEPSRLRHHGFPADVEASLSDAFRRLHLSGLAKDTAVEVPIGSIDDWPEILVSELHSAGIGHVLLLPIHIHSTQPRNQHRAMLTLFHDAPPGTLLDLGRRIAGVFAATLTIHEALEVARAATAETDAVLSAAVDAVVVIDQTGRIEIVNPSTEKIFGWTSKEMIGQNVRMLMPQPYRTDHDSYIDDYLRTGHARIIGIGREAKGIRKDGHVFPIDLAVGEIAPIGGRRRFLGIVRDISERKRTEHQLQEARERLAHVARISTMGEMASGIAHEVNQPLTAVATYANACRRILADGRTDDPDLMEGLIQISEEARRAGEIIHRLRDLVRRRPSERKACPINSVVTDVIRLAEVDTRLHDVRLDVHLHPNLPSVQVDPVQIQQVVLNLIRNATDAMETTEAERRVIEVRTLPTRGREIQVEVSDNGIGLPDNKAELYEPFFTTKTAGMGLGLSISRSIVNNHGGRLWHSTNPGGGTTFHFTLPVALGEANEE